MNEQYHIPYDDIPRGIDLALKNSDRHRTDAEILAEEKRYNSAVPIITLAVEEFGKALLLSEYFKKNVSILHKEGRYIFSSHRQRIDKVLDYVKDVVKQRTMSTRIKKDSTVASFHIPEESDDQDFKNRMWYVDYQKTQNPETQWKNQSWKNPLYIWQLDIGPEDYPASLVNKYYELKEDLVHGITKFRFSPLYDKILIALPPEKFNRESINSYLEKHFLLKKVPISTEYNETKIDTKIIPIHPWIKPILTEIIRDHFQKKYQINEVSITLKKE